MRFLPSKRYGWIEFHADIVRNRCSNTAFQSAGLRATASRNGARCFLPRSRPPRRLPSTLRPPPRRITPVRLRIPWDLLGCRSSEREIPNISLLFSPLFFGFLHGLGNSFCNSWWHLFIRFLGGHFLVLEGQFSESSSSGLSFFLSFFFLFSVSVSGSAFVVFLLSLFR